MPDKRTAKISKKACSYKKIIKNGQIIRMMIAICMLIAVMGIIFIDNSVTANLRAGLKKALTYDMSMGGMINELTAVKNDKEQQKSIDNGEDTAVGGDANVVEAFMMPGEQVLDTVYNLDTNELKIKCGNILSVRAMNEGTVTKAAQAEDGTFMMEIEHAENIRSIYRNCGMVYVKAGARIKRGALIGTANSADSVFYVTLFEGDTPKNPLDYIK